MTSASDYPFQLGPDGQMDAKYPGTSVNRLQVILKNVRDIDQSVLDGPWESCRRALLAAGGLRVDHSTSHAFNDDNHCDLTPMVGEVQSESNASGAVAQISRRNLLGPHIQAASLRDGDFAPKTAGGDAGGSWSTCTNGAHQNPPQDVAHVQFRSRIAYKLVWCPPKFEKFVLVDDEGNWLRTGTPTGQIPAGFHRKGNFELVMGGRYERVAVEVGAGKLEA